MAAEQLPTGMVAPQATAPSGDGREPTTTSHATSAAELDRLMDRYAEGDSAAFRELHRLLAPRLRLFLLRLSGGPALADDLLQETFLRMHRARGSFSKGAAVVPWSYAIARNAYIDLARKRKERSPSSLDDLPEGAHPEAPPGASPHAAMVARQTLDLVRATLSKLPVSQREAFILVRFEGMSMAEAAEVLDTTEAAVKVRAFRAYEAFRDALEKGDQK